MIGIRYCKLKFFNSKKESKRIFETFVKELFLQNGNFIIDSDIIEKNKKERGWKN